MPTLYIIDGNSYIHRAYHALPPLTTSKGEHVNAAYGFLRMLLKIIRNFKPDCMIVCFDLPGKTFRHEQYAAYKATRKTADPELITQFPISREAARALGLQIIEKEGFEADDLIATISSKSAEKGVDTVIVTGDKDALQLVDNNTKVLNEPKNTLFDAGKVIEKYGVKPGQLVDFFALTGDKTDNIPGVKGIGEKTASKLISEYGNLENLFDNIGKLPENIKQKLSAGINEARMSKKLVQLDKHAKIEFSPEECRVREPNTEKLIPLLNRLEVSSGILNEILSGSARPAKVECLKIVSRQDLQKALKIIEENKEVFISANAEGIGLTVTQGASFVLPDASQAFRQVLENPAIKKSGFNLKTIYLFFRRTGIILKGISFDSMIASYCLNPAKKSQELKNIVLEYLAENIDENDSCSCSESMLRVSRILAPMLKEKNLDKLFNEIEMPLVEILGEMEFAGIKVDLNYLAEISVEFQKELDTMEKNIFASAGRPFNINSPKQLAVILFEELKLPAVKRTKTGYSTDEGVLQALAKSHELPAKIIFYREIQKLKSTYIDTLIEIADPVTHRIHTTFNQAVTATGRLSSSNPNLQNIPIKSEIGRKIRRSFIPEEGKVFLSADYSQIDLCVLAHISKDPALINAFNAGKDIHTATASEIFGLKESEVNPEKRRFAKTINFGIVYGMSPFGLAQQLGISQDDAKKYIDSYFKKYSGVNLWIEEILKTARKTGYVSTLLNRIRYLPEINSKNPQMRSFAERMAVNTPIQGTSADIIKIAMINISKSLVGYPGCRMLLQIHDDLLFECPSDKIQAMSEEIKNIMENAVKLDVPLIVDIKTGPNWRDIQ